MGWFSRWLSDRRLQSPDERVRSRAVAALEGSADPAAAERLILFLNDSTEAASVREAAIAGLKRLRDPRAVKPLLAIAGDRPDGAFRYTVVAALKAFTDPTSVDTFVAVVADADEPERVRQVAAEALQAIRDPRCVTRLAPLVSQTDGWLRERIIAALDAIDPGWARSGEEGAPASAEPCCARCRTPFAWSDAWRESYDPNHGDTYWNKVYCPHCGHAVALDVGHGWTWCHDNAARNQVQNLPKSALVPWGRILPAQKRGGRSADRIDLSREAPREDQIANALVAQARPDFESFREQVGRLSPKPASLCWLIAAEGLKKSGRHLLSLQCYVEFLLRFPEADKADNGSWTWIAAAFLPQARRSGWISVKLKCPDDEVPTRGLRELPRRSHSDPRELDQLLRFVQQLVGAPGEEPDTGRVEIASVEGSGA